MSSLALQSDPRIEHVRCTDDELVVGLADGRTLSVPLAWFPRLANALPRDRADCELMGDGEGIHWPTLDEDIGVRGLLAGNHSFEHVAKQAKQARTEP